MKRSESGSAHVVIIAILAVALIGALGTLLWQNVINKPKDNEMKVVTSTSPTPSSTSTPVLKSYCAPLEKLCFDYPSDWKVLSETVDAETAGMAEQIVIKDADDQPWLRLQTGLSGVGGACGNTDNSYTKILTTHTAKIRDGVYAAAWAVYDGTDKNWTISMGLNGSDAVKSIGKVDVCDLGIGIVPGKYAKSGGIPGPGALMFRYYTGTETGKTYADEADATKALSSDGATKAFAILQDAHYE